MRNSIFIIALLLLTADLGGQYRMTLDTVLLGDVTVSGTVPLNNSQIENFYRTNYFSTIDNVTGHLDGMSLIKRGAYAMEPQLNGFSGGQLNVTIDGMRMFGACTDKMDPITSYLEPVNLKSITLQHGTNGGMHGNNVGGSMDLGLQEPENNGTHPFGASITTGYETVSHSRNLLVSTGYIKNKWAWGLNGVYRKNEVYRDGHNDKINHSQFEKYNIHSVFKFKADSSSSFRTDVLYDLALKVGYPALPMDVSRARAALIGLEYQRNRPKYDLKTKVYYNSVYHLMDDSGRDSLFFVNEPVSLKVDSVYMRMDMPGWSNTYGGFVLANINLDSKNRLTIKADSYFNNLLAEMTMHMHFAGAPPEPPMYLQTWPDLTRNVTGLYISNTTRFSSKFLLTVNGRLDYITDRFRSTVMQEQFTVFNLEIPDNLKQLTKSINLIGQYRIFSPFSLSFQTGFSERTPNISERFGFYLYNAYDGYDYIGNPELKTEKSTSVRLDLTYFKHNLKVNLSQSLNFLNDYIMGVTDTVIPPMNFYTNGLRVYDNISGVKMYSTDLQIMYRLSGGFNIFLLAKYTQGEMGSGIPLPLIPPLRNILSVSYERGNWTIQADNETSLRQRRINEDYGETASPAFSLFNIKTGYHIMLNGSMIDLSAGITNIFDKYYYEHLDWGHVPRQGRSFNFLIKFSY